MGGGGRWGNLVERSWIKICRFPFCRSQYFSLESQSTSPFRPRDTTPQESVAAPLHAGVKMAAASRLHPG